MTRWELVILVLRNQLTSTSSSKSREALELVSVQVSTTHDFTAFYLAKLTPFWCRCGHIYARRWYNATLQAIITFRTQFFFWAQKKFIKRQSLGPRVKPIHPHVNAPWPWTFRGKKKGERLKHPFTRRSFTSGLQVPRSPSWRPP